VSPRIWPGRSYPLGASPDSAGVNFAVFSQHAERVELCLFDEALGAPAVETLELPERTGHVFHGYVPGLGAGQLYGIRVHGPFDPRQGHRFDPRKLLLDPYARAVASDVDASAPVFGADPRPGRDDAAPGGGDSAAAAPKGVVTAGCAGPKSG